MHKSRGNCSIECSSALTRLSSDNTVRAVHFVTYRKAHIYPGGMLQVSWRCKYCPHESQQLQPRRLGIEPANGGCGMQSDGENKGGCVELLGPLYFRGRLRNLLRLVRIMYRRTKFESPTVDWIRIARNVILLTGVQGCAGPGVA